MSTINNIFNDNKVKSLLDVVSPPGMGFLIPEYQRPYKWSEENIERLIDDIIGGISRTASGSAEVLFLGTLIVVQTQNAELIDYSSNPKYAFPTGMYYVVDGQQRLSTLAILAIVLHRKFKTLLDKLNQRYNSRSDYNKYLATQKIISEYVIDKLTDFYSVKLSGTLNPTQKPLIVRKSDEFWVRNGSVEYKSPIARFIADYIDSGNEKDYSNEGELYLQIQQNQKKISSEIDSKLLVKDSLQYDSHDSENKLLIKIAKIIFPPIYQQDIEMLLDEDVLNSDSDLVALLKMCLFSLFMSLQCCVNYLEPKTHQWAIEVFQSLNSTGIPLSSLEVFKAYVHQNAAAIQDQTRLVKNVFDSVESLVIESRDQSYQTNIYLTALALGFDGTKLGTRHTEQHKYLTKRFDNYLKISPTSIVQRYVTHEFPLFDYMLRLFEYMYFRNKPDTSFVSDLDSKTQKAYVGLLFLESMGFNTVHPALALFFDNNNPKNNDFLGASLATTAFYALWRSVQSSSRLDNVARDLMKSGVNIGNKNVLMNWEQSLSNKPTLDDYKSALKVVLQRENILGKDEWVNRARGFLSYQNSAVLCRFILFLTAHDTIADLSVPGLIRSGAGGTHPFLFGDYWMSDKYNTVEHIAPQNPNDSSWDKNIYGGGSVPNIHHSIGNLTLLPKAMNSVLGNLNWAYKHKFYSHLANPSDDERRKELLDLNNTQGIRYTNAARNILADTKLYFHYLESIIRVSSTPGSWTREIVEKRTEQICSIAYDRLIKWLE